MGGKPAARKGDRTVHDGFIVTGFAKVQIEDQDAARRGDAQFCFRRDDNGIHLTGVIKKGSATVRIGGEYAARVDDKCPCCALNASAEAETDSVHGGPLPATPKNARAIDIEKMLLEGAIGEGIGLGSTVALSVLAELLFWKAIVDFTQAYAGCVDHALDAMNGNRRLYQALGRTAAQADFVLGLDEGIPNLGLLHEEPYEASGSPGVKRLNERSQRSRAKHGREASAAYIDEKNRIKEAYANLIDHGIFPPRKDGAPTALLARLSELRKISEDRRDLATYQNGTDNGVVPSYKLMKDVQLVAYLESKKRGHSPDSDPNELFREMMSKLEKSAEIRQILDGDIVNKFLYSKLKADVYSTARKNEGEVKDAVFRRSLELAVARGDLSHLDDVGEGDKVMKQVRDFEGALLEYQRRLLELRKSFESKDSSEPPEGGGVSGMGGVFTTGIPNRIRTGAAKVLIG